MSFRDALATTFTEEVLRVRSLDKSKDTTYPVFKEFERFLYDMQTLIEDLHLSRRPYRVLKNDGMRYVADIISRSPDELLYLWGFGIGCLNEVREKLWKMGLRLRND